MADDDAFFHERSGGSARFRCGGVMRPGGGGRKGAVVDRRSGLGDHLADGRGGGLKVIGGLGVFGGQPVVKVFEVGEPDIHVGRQRFDRLQTLVAAAVVDNGDMQAVLDLVQGFENIRQVLGGGDKIEIVRALGL